MHQLIWAVAGPMIWAAHFFLMYAAQTVLCTTMPGRADRHFTSAGIVLTAVAGLALLVLIGHRFATTHRDQGLDIAPSQPFLGQVQVVLAALSLLAVIWAAVAAAALPVCTPPSP